MRHYLVRTGAFGSVALFDAPDAVTVARHGRVICRTRRGLEVGQVLAPSRLPAADVKGTILRPMTPGDELVWARIERDKDDAWQQCAGLLRQHRLEIALVDAELLFDGQSLYFYFLGELPERLDAVLHQLAQAYEAQVRFREFTAAVNDGCGPDCGTELAAGCGSACGTCALSGSCAAR
jgi:cell fate regulator YaaT (PSP1 superfamily)